MLAPVRIAFMAPESQFASAVLPSEPPGRLTRGPGVVVCSSGYSRRNIADGRTTPSTTELAQNVGRREGSAKVGTKAAATGTFSFPFDDNQNGGLPRRGQNGAMANKLPKVEVSAKGKWRRVDDSALNDEDQPLPLPMTWPDSTPASKEEIEAMMNCDPEVKVCKDVIFQWSGDCNKCQGTGLVSFYRKKREIISKCMNCLGIGSVNKITSRASILGLDDDGDASSNGTPGGGRNKTNGKP